MVIQEILCTGNVARYIIRVRPDGPLFADFHALRHSYLTLGGRAGIDLRTLQVLAGHSTSALTERYTHVRLRDLAGAVEKLPSLLPQNHLQGEAQRATGTDAFVPADGPFARGLYKPVTAEAAGCYRVRRSRGREGETRLAPTLCSHKELRPVETG
jgi:hypothetical protein